MNNLFVSVAVHRIRLEIAMQHLFLRMQNDTEMSAVYLEFHLFYRIEGMCAVLCATLNDFVHNIVGMYGFIVPQIFAQIS